MMGRSKPYRMPVNTPLTKLGSFCPLAFQRPQLLCSLKFVVLARSWCKAKAVPKLAMFVRFTDEDASKYVAGMHQFYLKGIFNEALSSY